jgi:hypothetical protein
MRLRKHCRMSYHYSAVPSFRELFDCQSYLQHAVATNVTKSGVSSVWMPGEDGVTVPDADSDGLYSLYPPPPTRILYLLDKSLPAAASTGTVSALWSAPTETETDRRVAWLPGEATVVIHCPCT